MRSAVGNLGCISTLDRSYFIVVPSNVLELVSFSVERYFKFIFLVLKEVKFINFLAAMI